MKINKFNENKTENMWILFFEDREHYEHYIEIHKTEESVVNSFLIEVNKECKKQTKFKNQNIIISSVEEAYDIIDQFEYVDISYFKKDISEYTELPDYIKYGKDVKKYNI